MSPIIPPSDEYEDEMDLVANSYTGGECMWCGRVRVMKVELDIPGVDRTDFEICEKCERFQDQGLDGP